MTSICPDCGASVEESDAFCRACGTPLSHADSSAPEVVTEHAAPTDVAPGGELVIQVPSWLGGDWGTPARFAVVALFSGFVLQYIPAVVLLFIGQLVGDTGAIDVGETLRLPVTQFLAMHGPVNGIGVWAMGAVWITVGHIVAGFLVKPEHALGVPAPAERLWRFAATSALLYAALVTSLAAVFEPRGDEWRAFQLGLGGLPLAAGRGGWSLSSAFFLSLVLAVILALRVAARRTGTGGEALVGLNPIQRPPVLTAAWSGAMRTVRLALPLLLALWVIGIFLELPTEGVAFGRTMGLAILSILLGGAVWLGLDVGLLYMVSAMRFLGGEDALFSIDRPVWMWGGVVIVAAAFALGGYRAAQARAGEDASSLIVTAALVGPLVGVVLFVISWFVPRTGSEAVVGQALFLPILWGIVSGIGGAIYANQRGLLSSIRIQTASNPAEPEADGE